jgi:hypothetical protein
MSLGFSFGLIDQMSFGFGLIDRMSFGLIDHMSFGFGLIDRMSFGLIDRHVFSSRFLRRPPHRFGRVDVFAELLKSFKVLKMK